MPDKRQRKTKKSQGSRRTFLKQSSAITAFAFAPPLMMDAAANDIPNRIADSFEKVTVNLSLNKVQRKLQVEPRVTLLDLLREQLQLTGTKKGCDHGQCGACTVHVNGRRVNACLTLAVTTEGKEVTTIEGLADGDKLHPMQDAFIRHDGFQCGYCTPGQIMSAVACIREGHAGTPDEIREYMSGNICRCGAYSNIVEAINEVKQAGGAV